MEPILLTKILGGLAYAALEYWLGKTDKVKPGSVLEALITLPGSIINKEKPNEQTTDKRD